MTTAPIARLPGSTADRLKFDLNAFHPSINWFRSSEQKSVESWRKRSRPTPKNEENGTDQDLQPQRRYRYDGAMSF